MHAGGIPLNYGKETPIVFAIIDRARRELAGAGR